MNIRQKMILLLLAVGLLPALLLSAFAYASISESITEKTVDQLNSVAGKQADKISQLLSDMQFQAARINNEFTVNDAVGNYLATKQRAASVAIGQHLKAFMAKIQTMDAIQLIDATGNIFGSTSQDEIGQKLPSQEYATSADGTALMVLKRDTTDDINKLYIIAPYTFGSGRLGTVIAKFNLNSIVTVVQDYTGLGATGETVIAHREADDSAISLFALRFDTNAALNTHLDSLHLSEQSSTVYNDLVDYRSQHVIAATRYIPLVSWGLATKIDRDEALAPVIALRNTVIIIFVSAVIGTTLLALYLSRRVTAPIQAITAKARDISMGNLKQRLPLSSRDEIGALAAAFNTMTDQLTASYGALEQKVEERTAALNQKVEELGEAKAKDDAILDSMGEGLIVTDSAGVILLINQIAAGLMGKTREVLQNKPISDVTIYDEFNTALPPEASPTQIALQTSRKIVQEIRTVHDDGSKSSLSVTATPVVQAGKVIGVIQIIRDVTREKEVDRMKTEFISLASHQLRTPLSAIKWFTEMLLAGDAGKLNKEQLEFEHNVADSTERMIQLVNSLLNISRIESGRIIVDPKPTDLHELVGGIVNDLRAKVEEKKQTMAISIHKELPKVNLDQRLIGQVFLNLLTNAIKYTPKGGEISVVVSRKGDDLVAQVTDNGYGIPQSQQNKIFQKFFRAENAVKIESDGTGLGLYLIKSIVESSGGKIWFESKQDKGTTFWFSLPMTGMKAKAGEVTLGS